MTTEKPPVNYNDPRAHARLAELLENPAKYETVPRRVKEQLRASISVAESLPEGESRIALLNALSTALGDSRRKFELLAENTVLTEQLKATAPALAELNESASKVRIWVKLLHDKFNKCFEAEKKRGTDMWQTMWPWYDHELHTYTPAIVREFETLARRAQVTIPSAPQDDN